MSRIGLEISWTIYFHRLLTERGWQLSGSRHTLQSRWKSRRYCALDLGEFIVYEHSFQMSQPRRVVDNSMAFNFRELNYHFHTGSPNQIMNASPTKASHLWWLQWRPRTLSHPIITTGSALEASNFSEAHWCLALHTDLNLWRQMVFSVILQLVYLGSNRVLHFVPLLS